MIRFVEMVEGIDFKDALAFLDIGDSDRRPRKSQTERDKARRIRTWALTLGEAVGARLREIGQTQRLLGELPDQELAEQEIKSLQREWAIFVALDDDLANLETLPEMWREKTNIENFIRRLQ